MLVGKHYSRDYNCAHFVSEWYSEKLGLNVPVVDEFNLKFVVWMRRHFVQINSPEENCLVKMKGSDGSAHIGVYSDCGVYHNFKPINSPGSVCKWTIGAIKNYYQEVTYWKWSQ